MLSLRRGLPSSTSRSKSILQVARWRFASTEHGEAAHHPPVPQNESIGKSFYIALTLIPLTFLVYNFSRPSPAGQESPITKLIRKYSDYRDRWTERNTLHTRMAEQAAYDRHLFQSSPGGKTVELRFPEIFNTGAPWNVSAGHQANLGELIAHYEKQNRDEEARKAAALESETAGAAGKVGK